jgi:acyl dehydratase
MAVRGVYTEAEKKMIADFEKRTSTAFGWAKMPVHVATEESMKRTAQAWDCWNPLWQNDNYAVNTRWGGVIALPMYQDSFLRGAAFPVVPPSIGCLTRWYMGEDWEFFKPVRINDSFRVWRRQPKLVDVTNPDGKGQRKFQLLAGNAKVFNQKDEFVNTHKLYFELTISPEPVKEAEFEADYSYTKEELKYIEKIADEEKVRGGEIRLWEDVKIGEDITPTVIGPTTVWDLIVIMAIGGGLPMREMRKRIPETLVLDPATGVTHADTEWHFSDRQAQLRGEPRAYLSGAVSRLTIARLVTNWMGDDGFLRKFNWRHLARTIIGDTMIARGKVINKRIENGEHLIDLTVWIENVRGNITGAASVTVSLFSKEDI